jgi:hypothetical protein
MMCAIGQPFAFLIWSGGVCENNVVLEQAGILELYSDECNFGASSLFIMLASIGWAFSFIFCQIIGRVSNNVKDVFADVNTKKDGETDPDEDENYQAVAEYAVSYDDHGTVTEEPVEANGGAAAADALSKLLDDHNTACEEEESSILKSVKCSQEENRLVRKGSLSCLRTSTPCGPFDWICAVPASCDPS